MLLRCNLYLTEKSQNSIELEYKIVEKPLKWSQTCQRVCGLAIIDVTDGVADGHEESIVNEQVSDVNNQVSG